MYSNLSALSLDSVGQSHESLDSGVVTTGNAKVDSLNRVKCHNGVNGEASVNGVDKVNGVENGKTPEIVPTADTDLILNKKQKGTIDIWWLYDDGGKLFDV